MATSQTMIDSWYQDYLKNPPAAQTYQAAQAGVTDWTVGKDQTVQGQLEGILNKDGMLMQRAATQGRQGAARRGLLNSSIGIQAGEEALYGAAMPIASQDASTFARAGEFNANASNAASIANAGFVNDAGRFNAGARNDMAGMLFRTAADFGLEDARQRFQAGESAADRGWRTGERIGSQQFQTGESAADRAWRTGERAASEQFQAGQAEQDRGWRTGERIGSQQFQTGESAADRAWRTGERAASEQFQAGQAEQDRGWRTGESAADRAWRTGERAASEQFQAGQAEQDRGWRTGERIGSQQFQSGESAADRAWRQQERDAQFAQTLQRDQALFDNSLKTLVAQTDQELRLIDARNGTNLADQYRSATQGSYDAFIAEVTRIQQSDMDADVKAAQVADLQGLFASRQDYINVVFANQPGWSDEWAQFALDFNAPAGG